MREGNNILGVYACDLNNPPVAIRYLVDFSAPGAEITVTPDGQTYTVYEKTLHWFYVVFLRDSVINWSAKFKHLQWQNHADKPKAINMPRETA